MVKRLNPQQLSEVLISEYGNEPIVLCLDASSYDSSQRGLIFEVEKMLVKRIAPDLSELWEAIATQPNMLTSALSSVYSPCCRNSGEMTTALINTKLNDLMIRFSIKKGALIIKWRVEGDDNI